MRCTRPKKMLITNSAKILVWTHKLSFMHHKIQNSDLQRKYVLVPLLLPPFLPIHCHTLKI